jgi:hypothetical protein
VLSGKDKTDRLNLPFGKISSSFPLTIEETNQLLTNSINKPIRSISLDVLRPS